MGHHHGPLVTCFLNDRHSDWGEMDSRCPFSLLMAKDVEHPLRCLLTICTSSFASSLFSTMAPVFNRVVCFLAVFFAYSINRVNPLSDVYLAHTEWVFAHSADFLFS